MNTSTPTPLLRPRAFTLIELLVVIAVIGILAALIFPITAGIKRSRLIKVAQTELSQIEIAIESYKASRGHYPPDNPGNFLSNQLFFELKGTVLNNIGGIPTYVTLDGTGQIKAPPPLGSSTDFSMTYGANVKGFVNSSASAKGDDDKAAAKNYLVDLKPNQSGALSSGSMIKFLTCSILWDQPGAPVPGGVPNGMNPWRYISSNPTNNPTSYDLWIDILVGGKTNRISNWSKSPVVVAY